MLKTTSVGSSTNKEEILATDSIRHIFYGSREKAILEGPLKFDCFDPEISSFFLSLGSAQFKQQQLFGNRNIRGKY